MEFMLYTDLINDSLAKQTLYIVSKDYSTVFI